MRTVKKKTTAVVLWIALTLIMFTPATFAYPPDNAAALYYKAFLLYERDKQMEGRLGDLAKGRINLDETIKNYVKKNRNIINIAIDASQTANCDWGINYSEGMNVLIPHLSKMRILARLVITDAKILAEQGNYEGALNRCASVLKMGQHVSDGILIEYLVGISLRNLANNCIQSILGNMRPDLDTLNWLKSELLETELDPLAVKAAIITDAESCMADLRLEKKDELLRLLQDGCGASSVPEYISERLKNADEAFFARNTDYWRNLVSQQTAAVDLPYPHSHARLKELSEIPAKEAPQNPDATLAVVLTPAVQNVCSLDIRTKTFSNAIRAAVDIYSIKAKTGRLPEALPPNSPVDLFSGKDFEYERTNHSFIVRCRGKDLKEDKIHEYEFEVKK
jgi:hypothetical protein